MRLRANDQNGLFAAGARSAAMFAVNRVGGLLRSVVDGEG